MTVSPIQTPAYNASRFQTPPSLPPAPKTERKRRVKRLPRASKAIAWGKPDPFWGRLVCVTIERAMPPVQDWRYTRPRPALAASGWVGVVAVCLLAMAAGATVYHARGSNERTYVSNFHVQ